VNRAGLLRSFRIIVRRRTAMLGLIILAGVVFVAVCAPLLAPSDPRAQVLADRLQAPSRGHLLGTDDFGRDVLSRIIWGTRISLLVGVAAVGMGLVIGIVLGLTAFMRFVDALLSFPSILLGLAIMSILGPQLSNVVIAVGVSIIPRFARLVYGSVLTVKEAGFVEAARAVGQGDAAIIFRHILPNILGPIIVLATLSTASAILVEATLSFMGVGVDPSTPTWGSMVSGGRGCLRNAPWISTFAGLAIMVTVLALNMFGDGLRDALDPKTRTKKL